MTIPELDHRKLAAQYGVDPSEVGCLTYLIFLPLGFLLGIMSFLLSIIALPFVLVGALLTSIFGDSDQ